MTNDILPEQSNLKHYGFGGRQLEARDPLRSALPLTIREALKSSSDISLEPRYLRHAKSGELSDDPEAPLSKNYIRENQIAFIRHLDNYVSGMPSDRDRRRFSLSDHPDGYWILSQIDILEHTATAEIIIHPEVNGLGQIVDYHIDESQITHDDMVFALQHYGVKGMKWGVRRSAAALVKAAKGNRRKNEEPSDVEVSTSPGKKVKAKGGAGQPASEDAIRAATYKQKAAKSTTDSLSTKELQDLVTRMNLEQQYTRLTTDPGNKAVSEGKKFASEVLREAAKNTAKDILKETAQKKIKEAILGPKED